MGIALEALDFLYRSPIKRNVIDKVRLYRSSGLGEHSLPILANQDPQAKFVGGVLRDDRRQSRAGGRPVRRQRLAVKRRASTQKFLARPLPRHQRPQNEVAQCGQPEADAVASRSL